MSDVLAGTVRVRVKASPPKRTVVLSQPTPVRVQARSTPQRYLISAGPRGPAGATSEALPEIIVGNVAPVGRTAPWLRIEVDGDGQVQRVLLGTP